jgi:hypothetical protein
MGKELRSVPMIGLCSRVRVSGLDTSSQDVRHIQAKGFGDRHRHAQTRLLYPDDGSCPKPRTLIPGIHPTTYPLPPHPYPPAPCPCNIPLHLPLSLFPDPELPTVVLVGSPNVGKSSIVRMISTGTPEISNYPFTTRGMTLGHILSPEGQRLCQVTTTPERPTPHPIPLTPKPDTRKPSAKLVVPTLNSHNPAAHEPSRR